MIPVPSVTANARGIIMFGKDWHHSKPNGSGHGHRISRDMSLMDFRFSDKLLGLKLRQHSGIFEIRTMEIQSSGTPDGQNVREVRASQ